MTKVTGPLFGTRATGSVADFGTFRMGQHGPEFIQIAAQDGPASEAQARLRACFATARAAWLLITPTKVKRGGRWVWRRSPPWPDYWRQWLIDHPECKG